MKAWLLLLVASVATASESPLVARETADVLPAGRWQMGVFNPLQVGLGGGFELQAHPLLFLVSPNVVMRKQQAAVGDWTFTGELGLSMPTLAMRLTRGFLFPEAAEIGWTLVPRVGVMASFRPGSAPLAEGEAPNIQDPWRREAQVLTLSVDLAYGFELTEGEVGPLGTYAPLEMLLAPALADYRFRAGVAYDHRLLSWLRARAYADGYSHGSVTGNALTVRAGVGVDLQVGDRGRFTLGAVWWNSDQGAHDELGNFHRSNDFYPTVDFLWSW
ncbi:MAG: hypothetical protein M3Y59_26035 [Myxococcota bacterium]|nr:hypothetical protein [Myxococcota bacterium]